MLIWPCCHVVAIQSRIKLKLLFPNFTPRSAHCSVLYVPTKLNAVNQHRKSEELYVLPALDWHSHGTAESVFWITELVAQEDKHYYYFDTGIPMISGMYGKDIYTGLRNNLHRIRVQQLNRNKPGSLSDKVSRQSSTTQQFELPEQSSA